MAFDARAAAAFLGDAAAAALQVRLDRVNRIHEGVLGDARQRTRDGMVQEGPLLRAPFLPVFVNFNHGRPTCTHVTL